MSAIDKMDLKTIDNDAYSAYVKTQQDNSRDSDTAIENSMPRIDSTESKRILRKVDLRVIPILAILYFLSFLDRGNPFQWLRTILNYNLLV